MAGQLTNGGHLQGETLTLTAWWREQPFRWCSDEPECTECQYCDRVTRARYRVEAGFPERHRPSAERRQNPPAANSTLTAQVLANTGSGLVQAATLLLDVVNTVNGGRVLATGSADVKGTTLNNTGTLQGADPLVNYHTFSNSGTLPGTRLGGSRHSYHKRYRAAVQCRQPAA